MSDPIKTATSGISHPEGKENDLGKDLQKHHIKSEIDFLKSMELRAKIAKYAKAELIDKNEAAIAEYQSEDDKRIYKYYNNIINLAKQAGEDKNQNTEPYFKMQYLYNRLGHISLYAMAQKLAEADRKVQETENFKTFAFNTFGQDNNN